MRTTALAFTLAALALAGCAHPSPPVPDHKRLPEAGEDQHFCCASIDHQSRTGNDCIAVGVESINSCSTLIYCSEHWIKANGKVTCGGGSPCPGSWAKVDGVVTCK